MERRRTARKKMWLLLGVSLGMLWSLAVAEEQAAVGEKREKKSANSSFADSFSLTSRHEPIHIRSRDLEFRYEEKRIIYHGDVVAVQGDATLKSDLMTVLYEDVPAEAGAPLAKDNTGVDGATIEKAEASATPDAPLSVKEVVAEDKMNKDPTEASSTTENAGAKKEKIKKSEKTGQGQSQGEGQKTAKQRIKEIIAEGNVDITSGNRHATSKKAVFNEITRTVVLTGDAHVQELGNWVSGERVTVYLDENRSVVEGGGGDRRAEMEIVNQQGADKAETEKSGTEKTGTGKKGVKKQ